MHSASAMLSFLEQYSIYPDTSQVDAVPPYQEMTIHAPFAPANTSFYTNAQRKACNSPGKLSIGSVADGGKKPPRTYLVKGGRTELLFWKEPVSYPKMKSPTSLGMSEL